MKTAVKRIIAAVAVFGALSALCYSCTPVKVSAAVPETWEEVPAWALEELETTYNLYRNGLTAPIIEKIGALAFISGVYNGKKLYSQLEPEFAQNVQTLYSGFYYDVDGDIHVTTIYISGQSETRQFIGGASDEHYCIITANDNYPAPDYLHDCISTGNNISGGLHTRYIRAIDGRTTNIGFTYVNDAGVSTSVGSSYVVSYNGTRAATTCTAFPPTNTDWFGYLPGTDTDGNAVQIIAPAASVDNDLFDKTPVELNTYVNNYITINYPDSGVQIPEEEEPTEATIATLPMDEYSGLPAGWNEINPVPLPDIQTPSAPLTDAEMEEAHNWLTDFSFWASVQTGLAFWFAAAAHVAEINETLTGILLGVSLLSVLGYVLWRWGI